MGMAMTKTIDKHAQEAVPDGRRVRSERSRKSIIDAMLQLVEEGILVPTAQQVSERAGVGLRSVFRHFSDVESLFASADKEIRKQYQGLFAGGDRDGSLRERLQHAIEQRALAYEASGNYLLTNKAKLGAIPCFENSTFEHKAKCARISTTGCQSSRGSRQKSVK